MLSSLLFQDAVNNAANTLDSVYNIFKFISIAALAASVGNLLFMFLRLATTKDLKAKYDFINENEIKYLWRSSLLLIISAAFIVNTLFLNIEILWVGVRLFTTVMLGLIVGVTLFNILKFYYPFFIEKRLKKLRYTPRVSAKSGLPMVLLSEEEEDAYLDEGMQAEENAFSVDYDVWYCKTSGDVKIEKYLGHLHAEQCSSCNYQTLRIIKEEIVEKPSAEKDGLLMKYYKCSYCGHKVKKEQHLKLSSNLKVQNSAPVAYENTSA
jgi:hypothetical protein